ncbi:hypothetical protein A5881_003814 [Enterococcus termitis]|nr:hypothetical protein A5881_000183 [Enterococcus termitis]
MNETILMFAQRRKIKKILLITDRNDSFFTAYVNDTNRYNYIFSEYSMILAVDKFTPASSDVALEPAKKADAKMIASLETYESNEEVLSLDSDDLKKTFVLRRNKQIIASIRVENEEHSYGIYGFVVRADFRGQGIGRKIMSQLIQQLLERGAETVYLEVESTNDAAVHLYRSIGFEEQTLFDYYVYELSNKNV